MEKFRAIMASTTERHVDNALKVGATLAEVSFLSRDFVHHLIQLQLDPMSKLAVGLAKSIFDVSLSSY